MKNSILFISISLILFSCEQKITQNDIQKLNGYWEITKAVPNENEKKEYKVNETVDYFSVNNYKGFRQKVMPQFDGKFKTNNVKENFKVSKNKADFFINYETNYQEWNEEIVEITDSILVLKGKDVIFYYKKFTPFSLK